MKVAVFSNHFCTIPTLQLLLERKNLVALIVPLDSHNGNEPIIQWANHLSVPIKRVKKTDLNTSLIDWLSSFEIDILLSYTFSFKIPAKILALAKRGAFNVHFSLLPAYKGADPIFWQLKNGETTGGISIHNLDETFDGGILVAQQQIEFIPGESSGICYDCYSWHTSNMVIQLLERIESNKAVEILEPVAKESYYPKPTTADFLIDWDLFTAERLEDLVNACNQGSGGALASLKGRSLKILEISIVNQLGYQDTLPGTIIHIDSDGLFLQCLGRGIVRVNVVQTSQGIMTGAKFAKMGLKVGDRFNHYESPTNQNISQL